MDFNNDIQNFFTGYGNTNMKDENNHEPTVQAQQYGASIFRNNPVIQNRHPPANNMRPVEIGSYELTLWTRVIDFWPLDTIRVDYYPVLKKEEERKSKDRQFFSKIYICNE
jgi:hypothetical protein